MSGENRTKLTILTIAVLSLLIATLFSPQIGVEAKGQEQPAYGVEDVSSWLLRFAAAVPDYSQVLPRVSEAAPPIKTHTCL